MSRVRFRQSTTTYLPRYKKRTKKIHPLSTLQPENIPSLNLQDWNNDDFLNDSYQDFIHFNEVGIIIINILYVILYYCDTINFEGTTI